MHPYTSVTVKPFMFACPLLKGVNIDTVSTLIGITHVLQCAVWIRHNKGCQNTFALKIANFEGSQIKEFTILQYFSINQFSLFIQMSWICWQYLQQHPSLADVPLAIPHL